MSPIKPKIRSGKPSRADGRALPEARLFCEQGTGDARQGHAGNDELRREGLLGKTPSSPRGSWIVIRKVVLFLVLMGTVAGCLSYGGKPAPPPPKRETWSQIRQFPWPPPNPSAFATIPRELLVKKTSPKVGDVADRLENAFKQAGYGEKTWYPVPGSGGFALASRLEQFNPEDGTPMAEPDRWSTKIKAPDIFSLKDVLRSLFTAQKGYYRVIVFIVTNQPFSASDETVSPDDAMKWVQGGAFTLPDAVRKVDYTPGHYCVALIYEFEQSTRDNLAVFKAPSKLQGETHLRKAKIWSALGG